MRGTTRPPAGRRLPAAPGARSRAVRTSRGDAPECSSGIDLGTIVDVRAEYRSDDEAGAPRRDLSDLLLANCRAAALAFPRRAVASMGADGVAA